MLAAIVFAILYIPLGVIFSLTKKYCPIRFNGLPVSDERCGQFG